MKTKLYVISVYLSFSIMLLFIFFLAMSVLPLILLIFISTIKLISIRFLYLL